MYIAIMYISQTQYEGRPWLVKTYMWGRDGELSGAVGKSRLWLPAVAQSSSSAGKQQQQQTPGTLENRRLWKAAVIHCSYNSVCRELRWAFLPVGITVGREILTVRRIFRLGPNSSKSQADSRHTVLSVQILLSPRQTITNTVLLLTVGLVFASLSRWVHV